MAKDKRKHPGNLREFIPINTREDHNKWLTEDLYILMEERRVTKKKMTSNARELIRQ